MTAMRVRLRRDRSSWADSLCKLSDDRLAVARRKSSHCLNASSTSLLSFLLSALALALALTLAVAFGCERDCEDCV